MGASEIVNMIFSEEGILSIREENQVIYDITNLTPITSNSFTKRYRQTDQKRRRSYIEYILSIQHPETACKLLDVQPFRDIEHAYSSVAAWTYGIIMLVHITYMAILSYSGIMLLMRHSGAWGPSDSNLETYMLYIVGPSEPTLILLSDVARISKTFKSGLRKTSLPKLVGRLHSIAVTLWIVCYYTRAPIMCYSFSVSTCLGWLYTLAFTRGIRVIHYFWRMMQNMIAIDIAKFLFIYLFVLMAFTFAFHSFFQISESISVTHVSPLRSMFLVFNLMIGMDTLFTEKFNTLLKAEGYGAEAFVKCLYLLYMLLGTILLLNLLIAMMNDSYTSILNHQSVSWRIDTVKLGVDIEKSFPLSIKLFSPIKFSHKSMTELVKEREDAEMEMATAAEGDEHRRDSGSIVLTTKDRPEDSDCWTIVVPTKHQGDVHADDDETDREMMRKLKLRMMSMETKVTSDLGEIKHGLEDIRAVLRDLRHTQQGPGPSKTALETTAAPLGTPRLSVY